MSSLDFATDHLGIICHECIYRHHAATDPSSHAVEVTVETVEEDCYYFRAERWCANHCIRNHEKHLRYSGKSRSRHLFLLLLEVSKAVIATTD